MVTRHEKRLSYAPRKDFVLSVGLCKCPGEGRDWNGDVHVLGGVGVQEMGWLRSVE